MDSNNPYPNPYVKPTDNLGSAKELKENMKANNEYFAPSGNETPYDVMSKQIVNEVAPPQLNAYPNSQNYQPGYQQGHQQGYPTQPPMYPQGQGFPNQGPTYYNGPPPVRPVSPVMLQQPPTVVYVQGFNPAGGKCQYCNSNASVVSRKRSGCALWSWAAALCLFTGICCWIPCCIDDCYDTEFTCANCNNVRGYVKSPMGC